jgi:uncharacterized protein
MSERRFTPHAASRVSLEPRAADEQPAIVGYGAVFYDGTERTEYKLCDDLIERIMPGAFDRAIRERDDARGLFNHDSNLVLGRVSAGTMTLSVDPTGLRFSIVPGKTTVAADVMEHIRRGDVQGCSFAFRVTEQVWRTVGVIDYREIMAVELYDVGPVTFPAYEATSVGVRSKDVQDEAITARDAWRAGQQEILHRNRVRISEVAKIEAEI